MDKIKNILDDTKTLELDSDKIREEYNKVLKIFIDDFKVNTNITDIWFK